MNQFGNRLKYLEQQLPRSVLLLLIQNDNWLLFHKVFNVIFVILLIFCNIVLSDCKLSRVTGQ